MLILLPPSEGKSAPLRGPRLQLRTLSFPSLTPTRRDLLERLAQVCQSPTKARTVLGLGPTQDEEISRNTKLRTSPTAPAIEVYTGVVYEALDPQHLTKSQQDRLDQTVAIASALWGLIRPSDAIPAYRLSGDVKLPGTGTLANVWRTPVTDVLSDSPGPILDLRSGTYQFGDLPQREDIAVGRILLERNGKRSVVSHHNKATKGRLVRAVVTSRRSPRTLDDIADIASSIGIHTDIHEPARGPVRMDFIVTET